MEKIESDHIYIYIYKVSCSLSFEEIYLLFSNFEKIGFFIIFLFSDPTK